MKSTDESLTSAIKLFFGSFMTVTLFFLSPIEKLGIKFAPLNVPLERRLQTVAALGWILLMGFGELVSITLIVMIIRSDYYMLGIGYVMVIAAQRTSSGMGNRSWRWVRQWTWWKYLHDYFPTTLVKTTDLDPQKNYLLCIFPHGILSTGCFSCFATDGAGFEQIFPKMRAHMLTLGGHFLVPFFRELAAWLGFASASSETINYLLDKKNGTGKCAVLVVGGAAESLHCHPGVNKIVLRNRKGFVKIAMRNGVPIVPVYSFGETEIYDQAPNPEGSKMRRWQEWFRKKTGVAPLWPLGRGFFQYSFGVIPQRRPITTIVGRPLEVERNVDPTEEQVNEVHERFIKGLQEIFDEHKDKYILNESERQLIIV